MTNSGSNLPIDISSPSVNIAWYVQPQARSLSLMIPEPLKSNVTCREITTRICKRKKLSWYSVVLLCHKDLDITVVTPKIFNHGILKRNYRKMTIKSKNFIKEL